MQAPVEAVGVDDLTDLTVIEVAPQRGDRVIRGRRLHQGPGPEHGELVRSEPGAVGIGDASRQQIRQSVTKARFVA